jgi:hypothetical protein
MECNDRQGQSVDLTGATALQAVSYQEPREGAVASATYTVASGNLVVTNAVLGLITIIFDAGDLTPGEYVLEVTGTLVSGDVVLLRRDWFRVLGSHAL